MASLVGLASSVRGRPRAAVASAIRKICAVVLALAAILPAGRVEALVVGPDEALDVSFVFPSPPDAGGQSVDVVVLFPGAFGVTGMLSSLPAELFNGETSLGSGIPPSTAFIPFTDGAFANAISADLEQLTNPSFAGRIRLTPVFANDVGSIDVNPDRFIVRAGHGLSSGIFTVPPDATILSVEVPSARSIAAAPLPGALWLFASALGIAALAIFGFARNSARSRRKGLLR